MDKDYPLTAAEFSATIDTTGTDKNLEGDVAPATETPWMSNQTQMLFAMQRLNKHIFEGTDDLEGVAQRRAAKKRARAQRKVNRHNKS
jgi:hypothetical protein